MRGTKALTKDRTPVKLTMAHYFHAVKVMLHMLRHSPPLLVALFYGLTTSTENIAAADTLTPQQILDHAVNLSGTKEVKSVEEKNGDVILQGAPATAKTTPSDANKKPDEKQ